MPPRPQIVAHRGGACDHPENALSSFIAAARSGVDQIELDVHLSADSEPMVMHDALLEQTSYGEGPIAELTLAELKTIRLRGIDEPIPTLAEVLEAVGSMTHTCIEIKHDARGQPYAGMTDRVAGIVEARGLKDRVTIMGFEIASLLPFANAGFRTSYGYSRIFSHKEKDIRETVSILSGHGISGIGIFVDECDSLALECVSKAGISVGVWTVNGPSRLDYWLRAPVDHITTDQAQLALKLRERI